MIKPSEFIHPELAEKSQMKIGNFANTVEIN